MSIMTSPNTTIVVGGYATGENMLHYICEGVRPAIDGPVDGIRLVDALDHYDEFVEYVADKDLILYSLGVLVLDAVGSKPLVAKSILGIAPTSKSSTGRLVAKGIQAALSSNSSASGSKLVDGVSSGRPGTGDFLREIQQDRRRHMELLRRGSGFDTHSAARAIARRGIEVTLAHMESDIIFPSQYRLHEDQAGIQVVTIPGSHNEFSRRPAAILEAIRDAK